MPLLSPAVPCCPLRPPAVPDLLYGLAMRKQISIPSNRNKVTQWLLLRADAAMLRLLLLLLLLFLLLKQMLLLLLLKQML